MKILSKSKEFCHIFGSNPLTKVDGFLSGCIKSRLGKNFIRYSIFFNHLNKIANQFGLQLTSTSQSGLISGQNFWRLTSECFAIIIVVNSATESDCTIAFGSCKSNNLVFITAVYFEFNHDKAVVSYSLIGLFMWEVFCVFNFTSN